MSLADPSALEGIQGASMGPAQLGRLVDEPGGGGLRDGGCRSDLRHGHDERFLSAEALRLSLGSRTRALGDALSQTGGRTEFHGRGP
ncbi:MAG: hypothetical protein HOQ07_04830 [Sinomonas sp.]|nr:hypothetical protein [Sinomonas sp.]